MPLGMGSQQPSKDMTDRRIFAWVYASHRACLSWIVWLCLQQVAEKPITRRQKHPKSIKWNLWMVKLNEWSCINNFALPEAPENDLLEKVFTCACEAFLLDHQSVQKRFVIGLCSFSPHIFKALRVIQKDYSDEPAASISQISVPHFARCPLLWICLSLFENIKSSPCLDARAPHRSPLR